MPVECGVRLFDELDRLLGGGGDSGTDPTEIEGSPGRPGYECLVPAAVAEELAALAGGASEEAEAASVGADLVERCTVVDHEATNADPAVLEVAKRCDYAVTNDRSLGERLVEADIPVIRLRGRTKLEVTRT